MLKKRVFSSIISVIVTAAVFLCAFFGALPHFKTDVCAASVLKLSSAKSIAVARSDKIESLEIQIQAKEAARQSAIRSLSEKQRSMSTFRWSPLLNFSFPSTPTEQEAFEFAYKPTQLQYAIDTLKHKMTDTRLDEYETVSNLYIDIISSTAEITFIKNRISSLETALHKNKARVVEGTASQSDVEKQEKSIESLEKELTSEEKTLVKAEKKLGDKLGFSITSGYKFEEAFVATKMDRDTLEYLKTYTIENDQTVYEAKQDMDLARLALVTNYSLMKNQYGGNIGMISGYIQQALDGSTISKKAFKKAYDSFLKAIDQPWQGSYRILFFSFPKEWFKGDTDGIRYIEDDPYVLYSAALDYEAAVKEYNNTCNDISSAIEDGYDAMIDARNAYLTAQNDYKSSAAHLIYSEAQNALGLLSAEEYDNEKEEFEDVRSSLKDALSTYSSTLYSFDRTTCGAASAYFSEESLSTQTGVTGLAGSESGNGLDSDLAQLNSVVKKGATYSIRSIVDSEEFMLYVDIPDDFEYTVTDFELWCDGHRIGQRTAVGDSLRHLRLSIDDVSECFIRLYNSSEFIDDCAIDPTVSYGPLIISSEYLDDKTENYTVIGSYSVTDDENTDMINIRFNFDQTAVRKAYQLGEEVAYYNMAAEQNLYLFSNDLTEADKAFTYLGFIKGDIGKLTLRLFDSEGNYIGGAKFNTDTYSLYVDEEITLADMQKMAAKQILTEMKEEELSNELDRLQDLLNAAESVNGSQADSATIAYYKERIAKLKEKLDTVSDSLTDEEIAEALVLYASKIDEIVAAMGSEESAGISSYGDLTEEEVEARNNILKDHAEDFVKKLKADSMRQSIESSIKENKQELYLLYRQMEKADREGDESLYETLKKEYDSLLLDTEVLENKLSGIYDDGFDASEEEIEAALMEYGDEIYAASADQLSDAMIYGSAVGQWAKAYLETEGLEQSNENIRLVVSAAANYKIYEAAVDRESILNSEIEKTKATISKLRSQGSTADLSCAEQLENILASYEKEIVEVKQRIIDYDPGKAVKEKYAT